MTSKQAEQFIKNVKAVDRSINAVVNAVGKLTAVCPNEHDRVILATFEEFIHSQKNMFIRFVSRLTIDQTVKVVAMEVLGAEI